MSMFTFIIFLIGFALGTACYHVATHPDAQAKLGAAWAWVVAKVKKK